ncbi:phenylacetate--CoA ligase family protein [Kitasatospora sp. RG8]|uniref:phenylacetate--CoA ligase family protein n=1 Tax=Kitasatospora sp. RG8 TaxID=2820815 RepID=UPI001ADF96F6|nr:phenylacetate--CoA ligase family protein [Kitasatospora sp. RG8]MBP0448681.1 phenylacetate--CoA ligase family protein [Kitasatospora sp. RG8]
MQNHSSDPKIAVSEIGEKLNRFLRSARYAEKRAEIEKLVEFDSATAADRLAGILAHARDRVPRYRSLQDHVKPVLTDFPLTRKADLRDRFIDLISRDETGRMEPGHYFIHETSGSTGEPVRLMTTAETGGLSSLVIAERLCRHLDLPDTGTELNLGLHYEGTPLVEAGFLPRPYVRCNLRGFDPSSPSIVETYASVVGAFPVDRIIGTSSRLVGLARYCLEQGIRLRPKAVVASYEHLVEEGRRMVEDAFRCPVTTVYATSETGSAAWECRQGNLHFQDDFVTPELLPYDGDETLRSIVLTGLLTRAMPVIRYVTGDLCSPATACGCGLPGTAVGSLVGRSKATLVGADGLVYSPYALLAALSNAGLADFQVLQEHPGILQLIVPDATEDARRCVEHINRDLASYFREGQGFRLRLAATGTFVLSGRGKRNPVVQRLDVAPGAVEGTGYLRSGVRSPAYAGPVAQGPSVP